MENTEVNILEYIVAGVAEISYYYSRSAGTSTGLYLFVFTLTQLHNLIHNFYLVPKFSITHRQLSLLSYELISGPGRLLKTKLR